MSRLGSVGLRVLLAVGLSFALWAFVSFSENPDEQVTFEDLSLSVRGLAPNLVLVDRNSLPNPALTTVDVTVVTDRRQRNQIRPVDLRAFVDLTDLGPGDYNLDTAVEVVRSDLSVTVPRDGITPGSVPIRIEELITRTVPITLDIQGNLPFSFELGSPSIARNGRQVETAVVTGPQSRAERVVAARTVANVDQIRASYSAPLQLQPVDATGQLVEGVTLEPLTVNVTIPIRPVVGLRLVPISAEVIGLPAPGFAVTAVEITPQLITLAGSSGALDRVETISTRPINISGARGPVEREVGLVLPQGTSVGAGEREVVRVVVRVAPLERPFQVSLPVQVVPSGVERGLTASVQPSVISVTFSGQLPALEALARQPLVAEAPAAGLAPGVYTVTPLLGLPAGVRIEGPVPQVTLSLRAPPTPTPTETATATPGAEGATPTPSGTPAAEGETPTPEAPPAPEATPTATAELPSPTSPPP